MIQIQKFSQLIAKYLPALSAKKVTEVTAKKTIGLNIGRANIVACEVSQQDGKLTLERCAYKPIVKEKAIALQVKGFFQEAKFQPANVNVPLKGQGVVVRFLSFPRMSRSDFTSSIQFEAEKYLPFSLTDVVLDYHIIDEGKTASAESGNSMQVILVAARKTEVDKMLNLAKEVGFKLNAIDVDIFACANAFEHANPDLKTHSVGLIDFGAMDTTFGIFDKGMLVFSRDVAFGGNDLTELIKRKLSVSPEEAYKIQHESQLSQPDQIGAVEEGLERLFQELQSSINYYYNQHQSATPIETIYISGGFSRLSILPELLEKRMQTPIKKWDPTSKLTIGGALNSESLRELIPHLPVCVGLAIRSK